MPYTATAWTIRRSTHHFLFTVAYLKPSGTLIYPTAHTESLSLEDGAHWKTSLYVFAFHSAEMFS